MTAFTKLSAKGQVVVPKATRDRLGWTVGTDLEVVETGDAVVLRPRRQPGRLSVEEAVAAFKRIYRHEGPPVPVDQLGWSHDIEDGA